MAIIMWLHDVCFSNDKKRKNNAEKGYSEKTMKKKVAAAER